MALQASITLDNNVSCNGGADGTATASASGGTAPYGYLWSASAGGQTTATASNLPAGTHTVSITDANNCTAVASITITEPTALLVSISLIDNVSCNGGADGSASASASGGTTAYSYQWGASAGNQTTATATNLPAGTHTIVVTDANGCVATASVTVDEPAALTATTTLNSNVSCFGLSDGSATVSATGGTPAYSYLWDNGEVTATAIALAAGNHTVTVTDANGCSDVATINISQPTLLTATTTVDNNVSCNGGNDASATVTAAGGTPGYSYQWDAATGGQTTATASNLSAGTYSVTVTDDNGCSTTASVTITEPAVLQASIDLNNNVSCNGGADGSATASASGGTPAYGYQWSASAGSQTTATASNLPAGAHTVTITDANNCSATASIIVTEPTTLLVSTSLIDNVSCNGGADGSASASASGGTPPYNYQWSASAGNQTTATATNLPAGTHIISVTDDNGCVATADVTVSEPAALTATTTLNSNVSCFGLSDGSATVSVTGGTPAYSYLWDNGEVTATAIALAAGNHAVTVTDANGCSDIATINISEPTLLTASTSVDNNVSCNGGNDASATVTAAGGTPGYSYQWDAAAGGQTTATASNLSAGTYSVTVTDDNGCSTTASVTITEPAVLQASVSLGNNVSCNGGADGSATASASGGTPAYGYQWSASAGGQTTATASNLPAGTHIVTITDANNCSATASIIVTEPTTLLVSTSLIDNVSCNGGADGSASASASGGTPPYVYQWSASAGNQTTATATNLPAGTHIITVTDNNGCVATADVTVSEPAALAASASLNSNVSCFGLSDGSATVSVTGGTPAYSYLWDNGEVTATATALAAGNHAVTVTDANGCTDIATINISEPPLLTATTAVDNNVSCNGGNDAIAMVTATGGTSGYSYQWDAAAGNQTTATAINLSAGTYSVTVTDDNGCSTTASVTITEPTVLQASISLNNDVSCNAGTDGSATASGSGGTLPYNYEWGASAGGQTTATAVNLPAGTHLVTITDNNGCTATASIVVDEPTVLLANTTLNNDVSCNGGADGSATVSATGGTPPYAYIWDNSEVTATATNLDAGVHVVGVIDANGCTASASVTISEPALLSATTALNNDVSCNGGSDGNATVTATGGVLPYSFLWDNGEVTATAIGLNVGIHSVTVTDDNACSVVATVVVDEPTVLTISTSSVDENCASSNGSITVVVNGGTPDYQYSINGGTPQTSGVFNGLPSGAYDILVTDANGCTITAQEFLIDLAGPSIDGVAPTSSTCSDANGSFVVGVSLGTPPYEYSINGGMPQASNTFTGLLAGTYDIFGNRCY